MKPQQKTIGIKSIPAIQNRMVGGFVVSKPWGISTSNLHKNIIKSPV